jgi:Cu+-exporting ATPase
MVGDGLNDLYALKAADLSVLTVQQDTRPALELCQVADEIIRDIQELPEIVRAYPRNLLFPPGREKK